MHLVAAHDLDLQSTYLNGNSRDANLLEQFETKEKSIQRSN